MAKKRSSKKSAKKASAKRAASSSARKSTAQKAKKASKSTRGPKAAGTSSGKKRSKKTSAKKTQAKKSKAKKASSKKSASRKASAKARKVRTPLNKKELGEFREMLIEKRRELIGDMNGIEADALGKDRQDDRPEAFNMPTHPADVGTDNYEQEFTLGLLESERILLQEINDALERIERKTFGICLGTGDPIGLPRLRARPWSKYCIEYQRQLEKGLVRPVEDEDDEHAYGGVDEEDLDQEEDEAESDDDEQIEEEQDVEVENEDDF